MSALAHAPALVGLRAAPAQYWCGARLVPLLRDAVPGDLRLARRSYGDALGVVDLGCKPTAKGGLAYVSYVPHGFVVDWSDDGSPLASFGTHLERPDGDALGRWPIRVRLHHRMARREDRNRLRFLPLHLALEGFLAWHFGGPDIAWSEYSHAVLARGLSPRWEQAVPGGRFPGLRDALRVFEIHDGQVGVLLFLGEELASVFVVPHPDDYRALHQTLLEDAFAEDLTWAARHAPPRELVGLALEDEGVQSVEALGAALETMRGRWRDMAATMAQGLLGRPAEVEPVYDLGHFRLLRFITSVDPSRENHVGEAIVRDDGTLEYCKTYRLSAAQTKRAYLLSVLAGTRWNLDAAAAALGADHAGLVLRLERAGFGYLLKEHVLAEARRRKPRRRHGH